MMPDRSPPTQNGLKQLVTAPVPVATPFEPYWNWRGAPLAPKAMPCSGPFVIRPYLAYWICWAPLMTRYCGRPSVVEPIGRTWMAGEANQSRPPAWFRPKSPARTPASRLYSALPMTRRRPSKNDLPPANWATTVSLS